jgi:hypothetical protein
MHRSKTLAIMARLVAVVGVAAGATAAVCTPAFAAPAAPINVRAFTGGNSIALRWNPAAMTKPTRYEVYRNGGRVATVQAPASESWVNTARYIDTSVVAGRTYRYQVLTITTASNGATERSSLSASVSATQPLAANTTPVPTVTASTTLPELTALVANAKTLVQTWYPKFADVLARPAYAPPASIVIRTEPCNGGAYTDGNNIVLCEAYALKLVNDVNSPGTVLHEMTHVIQQYQNTPGWIVEGMAVWGTHEIYNDAPDFALGAPGAQNSYQAGYDKAASFVKWISTTYNKPNLARDLNIAANAGNNAAQFFVNQTGKTVQQLWQQLTGIMPADYKFLSTSGVCIEDKGWITDNGNPIQTGSCWDAPPQMFTLWPATAGSDIGQLQTVGKCVDTVGDGVSDGTRIVVDDCSTSASQQWRHDAQRGWLVNTNSNKCAQPVGGLVPGTAGADVYLELELAACNDQSPAQRWTKQTL